jgi:hypothetical protein
MPGPEHDDLNAIDVETPQGCSTVRVCQDRTIGRGLC